MREKIEQLVRKALAEAQAKGDLPQFEVEDLGLERPADASNGDWTSTVAMRSARLAHKSPRDIAAALVAHMPDVPEIERVEIAGPGFVNFYLSTAAGNEIFRTIREQGADFGKSDCGKGTKSMPAMMLSVSITLTITALRWTFLALQSQSAIFS